MIQCKKCNVEHIGETKISATNLVNKDAQSKKRSHNHTFGHPTAVSVDHFTLLVHYMDNIELIPLELIDSNREATCKAREASLISKGKTLEIKCLYIFLMYALLCKLPFSLFCQPIMSHISFPVISSFVTVLSIFN